MTTASQTEIDFTSYSPINTVKLGGQNKRLYEYLLSGKTINCMSKAMDELKIGYLNSRASDLKKHGIMLYKRFIVIDETTVKEYSLNEF